MSFWDKLRAWLQVRKGDRSAAKRVYIIDAGHLASRNGGNRGRIPPRAQLDTLRRLGQFARKESIQIHAVFEGRPLRKAPDGGKFEDVTVHYAPKGDALPDLVVDLMKDASRRKEVTVITSDRRLEERVLVNGGTTIRVSTFRKALEATIGSRGGHHQRDPSQRRRRRRRRPRSGAPREEQKKAKPQDPVDELIDLVD
jgi:hypothetical protein